MEIGSEPARRPSATSWLSRRVRRHRSRFPRRCGGRTSRSLRSLVLPWIAPTGSRQGRKTARRRVTSLDRRRACRTAPREGARLAGKLKSDIVLYAGDAGGELGPPDRCSRALHGAGALGHAVTAAPTAPDPRFRRRLGHDPNATPAACAREDNLAERFPTEPSATSCLPPPQGACSRAGSASRSGPAERTTLRLRSRSVRGTSGSRRTGSFPPRLDRRSRSSQQRR